MYSRRLKNEKEANIKCEKCGYAWRTKSKLKKVTCPNCCSAVKNLKKGGITE